MTDPNPGSVLDSVKKVIGFSPDYTAFDLDITMFINATFGSLQQLGVGPDGGFVINDNTGLWTDFTDRTDLLGMIKQYMSLNVRMAFDTPERFGIAAFEKIIEELGWRINVAAENPPGTLDDFGDDFDEEEDFVVKIVQLPSLSAVTPDASTGNTFYLALQNDCMINLPINGKDGERIMLQVTSNGFAVTWAVGWNFGDAGTPSLSTGGKTDIISAVYRQSTAKWDAGASTGF